MALLRAIGGFFVLLGQGVVFLIVGGGLAVLVAAAFLQKPKR